jgi:CelD/BcsL family acetyltransferase involved in cellulose biosynthesis
MRLEVITRLEELSRLRHDWDAVYDADDEAQFFLSWPWMARRLQDLGTSWFVLAARAESDPSACIGFLPLSIRQTRRGNEVRRELRMAGSPVADYTGFIYRPEHERDVLSGFAEGLQRLAHRIGWDDLNITGIRASDERLRAFLACFSAARFDVERRSSINRDGVDNSVCPYVALPDDWQEYLGECVSSNTRQKLRRLLRQAEASPEFRITQATPDTIERDIDVLLRLWEARWGGRKHDRMAGIRNQTSSMLMRCFEDGCLFLPSFRYNGTAVGALAILLDHRKKSYLFYMGGRDPAFAAPPPGLCLHAFSIRHAIENGFKTYDFLRGDEAYKFSFGAKKHFITSLVLRAKPKARSGLGPNSSDASSSPAHARSLAEREGAAR